MKRLFCMLILTALFALLLTGCGSRNVSAPFNGVLDTDTSIVYKLGDAKEVFDSAFGQPKFDKKHNQYDYLSEILTVTFDENNCASCIESSGKSNRFAFFDFDFNKPLNEIEGRYEKFDEPSGYIFYNKYFDEHGAPCSVGDAVYSATLMVRDGDLEILHLKDGEYVSYWIEILDF